MNDNPVNGKAAGFEYAGAKYPLCCGDCPTAFKADPTKFIKNSATAGNTIGLFLFDPTTGVRIDTNKATVSSDYQGLRYFFKNSDEKAKFDADPAKFTDTPERETLVCAADNNTLKDYGSAYGYIDYKNTRYYVDNADSFVQMKKDMPAASVNPELKFQSPSVIMGRNNTPKGI